MKPTMGMVGFGRFGRFAGSHLKDHFDLLIFDRSDRREEVARMGLRMGTLEEVARSSVVLLCVPISEIRTTLMEISPHLTEGSLLVDTCSVKEYPVAQMKRLLPLHVEILGTHPLFGPDSAREGLRGKKIVLCPVRVRHLRAVKAFMRRLGLTVLVSSPEAHDQAMASTQVIVHFLGKALLEIGLTRQTMATPSYDILIRILETVQNDTWELFHDLQTFNRFAEETREELVETLTTLNQKLELKIERR